MVGNSQQRKTLARLQSTNVRHRQQILLDQRKCTFQAWAHLKSRTAYCNTVSPRGQQTSFSFFNNDRLDKSPRFSNLTADHDHFWIEAIDQARNSDTQIACGLAH